MTRLECLKQFIKTKWNVEISEQQLLMNKFEFNSCDGIECPAAEEGETAFDLCDRCKYLGFWEGDADEIL